MKYLVLILLVLNTLDVLSQNQSLPVLKMYKSDKSVTITPLTDIDSLVHVSIVPVNLTLLDIKNITNTSARFEAKILSKVKALLAKLDIVGVHFKIQLFYQTKLTVLGQIVSTFRILSIVLLRTPSIM